MKRPKWVGRGKNLRMMDLADSKIISSNVNSLKKRRTDIHAYVFSNNVDIIALQEVGSGVSQIHLKNYQRFELLADSASNTRGLITFVKNSIPVTFLCSYKQNGTECVCIIVHLNDGEFVLLTLMYMLILWQY